MRASVSVILSLFPGEFDGRAGRIGRIDYGRAGFTSWIERFLGLPESESVLDQVPEDILVGPPGHRLAGPPRATTAATAVAPAVCRWAGTSHRPGCALRRVS